LGKFLGLNVSSLGTCQYKSIKEPGLPVEFFWVFAITIFKTVCSENVFDVNYRRLYV